VQPHPLRHHNEDVGSLELNLDQTNFHVLCSLLSIIYFSSLYLQVLAVIFTCDIALIHNQERASSIKLSPLLTPICSSF
jgi:hypothetical protein